MSTTTYEIMMRQLEMDMKIKSSLSDFKYVHNLQPNLVGTGKYYSRGVWSGIGGPHCFDISLTTSSSHLDKYHRAIKALIPNVKIKTEKDSHTVTFSLRVRITYAEVKSYIDALWIMFPEHHPK